MSCPPGRLVKSPCRSARFALSLTPDSDTAHRNGLGNDLRIIDEAICGMCFVDPSPSRSRGFSAGEETANDVTKHELPYGSRRHDGCAFYDGRRLRAPVC